MKKTNDIAKLTAQAKKGDKKAKEQLYNETNKSAYFVALKIVKNEDDAMDILQDSYLKAFTDIDKLADNSKFVSWFNCIVANNCKNYMKKKKPDFFTDISYDDESDFEPEDTNCELPSEIAEKEDVKERVQMLIDNLSEEQKLCVMMYYFEDMSIQDIADSLGVSTGTVKSRLNYARKKMKTEIDNLEKSGVSLGAVTAGAMFKAVLGNEASKIVVPKAILGTAVTAGTATTGGIISTIAGTSLAVKVVSAVAIVAVATGGGTGIYHAVKSDNNSVNANTSISSIDSSKADESSEIKVKSIKLDKTTLDIVIGKQDFITATVLPEDTTQDKGVTFESSDTSIATVDSNGKIVAKGVGSCVITCTLKEDCSVKGTVKVTCNAIKVNKIVAKGIAVKEGSASKITAVVNKDATDKSLIYKSSNAKIATVDQKGNIKGIKEGTCKIVITSKDGGASTEVTVKVTNKYGVKRFTKAKTLYSNSVNFFKTPSTADTIKSQPNLIKYLPVNTKIKALGETKSWYYVEVNSTRGFVMKQYVQSTPVQQQTTQSYTDYSYNNSNNNYSNNYSNNNYSNNNYSNNYSNNNNSGGNSGKSYSGGSTSGGNSHGSTSGGSTGGSSGSKSGGSTWTPSAEDRALFAEQQALGYWMD